jgi:hypothetical protein
MLLSSKFYGILKTLLNLISAFRNYAGHCDLHVGACAAKKYHDINLINCTVVVLRRTTIFLTSLVSLQKETQNFK